METLDRISLGGRGTWLRRTPEGKKPIGRPKYEQIDNVSLDLGSLGGWRRITG